MIERSLQILLPNEKATETLGADLANIAEPGWIIYLQGELGAGKTTLTRGFLRQLGYQGNVKSPTYTLVEPYTLDSFPSVFHFDLYRVADPDELEFIGLRDFLNHDGILLIEWPQQGEGILPPADVNLSLSYTDNGRLCILSIISERAQIRFSQLDSKSTFSNF